LTSIDVGPFADDHPLRWDEDADMGADDGEYDDSDDDVANSILRRRSCWQRLHPATAFSKATVMPTRGYGD
jgi:hypothetical protein